MLNQMARCAALAAAASLAAFAPGTQAQSPPPAPGYQRVWAGDLIGGYHAEGTRVEARGRIGVEGDAVTFKTSEISAQGPMTIETAALPRALLERLARQCAWTGAASGGCQATVRGTVLPKSTRSLAADDIVTE